MNKKIVMIGSSQYREKFSEAKEQIEKNGDTVMMPAFDDRQELDPLGICDYNRSLIEQADEVHIIWDNRSVGTIFDFGMAFALRKKIVIRYIEPKTFEQVMRQYEDRCM